MAAGEGFEPSHTESESAVLPLHNPAMFLTNKIYYTRFPAFVNTFFALLEKRRDLILDCAKVNGLRTV